MSGESIVAASSPRVRGMGTLALLGVLAFASVATVLQWVRVDLDWVRAPLSFYLIGPHGLWLQLAYVALAVTLAAIGLGYHRAMEAPARSRLAVGLFVLGAVALAVTAVAETDRGGGRALTVAAQVHALAAPLAFLGTTLGMLVLSWSLRADPRWRRRFALAFGLAVFCFVALWIHALWRELPRGLSQKVVIVAILAWLALASLWLRRPIDYQVNQ
ncbi:MAG TPA: DUF998 domain-containing protein [Lysobacter sp.]